MPVQSHVSPHFAGSSRFLVLVVLIAGIGVLARGVIQWHPIDPGLFLGYLIISTAAAALRIKLPSLTGDLSVHFFFVLLCIPNLSLLETLIIAAAGATLQGIFFMKPSRALAIAFDISVSLIASGSAYLLFGVLAQAGPAGRSPLLFIVAAAALFLGYTTLPAAAIALSQQRPMLQTWRDDFLWTFPHYLAGGGAAGLLSLIGNRTGWETALLILPVLYWMYNSYRYYLQLLDDERRQVRDVGGLHFRTIEALALAIEGHDATKRGHLRRVSIYTAEIGRRMGLSEPELQALLTASMLHDIGKLAVPEHIITKPGKLTDSEFERMKIHPIAGAEILEQVQFPYSVAPVVRAHHERWDGTGYPAGLKGLQIPIGARILAAVDCLDALISDRHYRSPLTLEQAIQHVQSESGKSFDPEVVAILAAHYREFEEKVQAAEQHDPRVGIPANLARIAAARHEEQQFFQLARELGNSLSLDKTLEACVDRVCVMCPCDSVVVFLQREDSLEPEYASGAFLDDLMTMRVTRAEGVAGWVMDHGSPVLNADPALELIGCGGAAASELRCAMAVPIEGVTDRIGVIALYSRAKDVFTVDHLRILTGVAARASGAIENALKYIEAEESATTDVLTGLANARSLFLHLDGELARARRNHDSVTVLMCDLDRFKQLNDNHGHMEGNRALKLIAQALKKQCREYDFVARMGGDEFVLVIPSHRTVSVESKIEQLRHAVFQAIVEIPGAVGLGMSIGHASFPEDGRDAEALLAVADQRMYRMKQMSAMQTVDTAAEELRRLGEKLGPRPTAVN